MKVLRTFSIAGAVLAMATVASPAALRQEGDVRAERVSSFRADYDKVMKHYEGVFRKLDHSRGLRLAGDARASMRALTDDQLAKLLDRVKAVDLSTAVHAAAKLEAVTPTRGTSTSRGPDTPGFPGAPPILAACDNIAHDSQFTFGALVAFQVLRTVLAAAEFACLETIVILGEGGNGSLVCIPFAVAQDVAAIPYELADFCGGEEDSAIGQGSYDRLEHIHTDIEDARADIIANDNTNRDLIIANDNANREFILAAMRALSCDLERLVHTPEGKRESSILECVGQPGFPYDFPEK